MNRVLRVAAFLAIMPLSVLVHAQQQTTRGQLNSYNNTNITANGRGAITGPILNNMLGQIINGSAIPGDTNTFSGANSYTINPSFLACTGYPFSSGSAPLGCSPTIPTANLSGTISGAQLSGLLSCTAGSNVAPVPAGQAFQCSGVILIAQ